MYGVYLGACIKGVLYRELYIKVLYGGGTIYRDVYDVICGVLYLGGYMMEDICKGLY